MNLRSLARMLGGKSLPAADFIAGAGGISPTVAPPPLQTPALLPPQFAMPKAQGLLGKLGGTLGKGLTAVSKAAPVIGGVTQAVDSGVAISDALTSTEDLAELERKLLSASAGGKGLQGLSIDDQRAIQKIRRGGQDYKGGEFGDFLGGAGKGLGGAAITGALGLIPGMQWLLPIAAAQLATSGVRGIGEGKNKKTSELAELYNRLQQSAGATQNMM
jgi:hypothetical protein